MVHTAMSESGRLAACEADEREKIIKTNQCKSPFLQLPPEIRNTIYEMALHDVKIKLMGDKGRRSRDLEDNNSTALIQTCRQIRHEALPVFYAQTKFYMGENTLCLSEELEVEMWELGAIQAIELDAWYLSLEISFTFDSPTEFCRYAPVARTNFAKFTSLKHVHVRRDSGYSMESIKLFVDCLLKGKDVQLHL